MSFGVGQHGWISYTTQQSHGRAVLELLLSLDACPPERRRGPGRNQLGVGMQP